MKSSFLPFWATLLLAATGPLHAADTAAPTPPPNVIILLTDDLGRADVSCLSDGAVKTPNIDRIAQQGVRFPAGYVSAPLCGPSRAGFFTGVYQERFGFVGNNGGIPANMPMLPGMLHDAGYRTALIGKWHSTGPMPHERGCFDETLCSAVSTPFIDYHHPKLARNGTPTTFDTYSTDLFADEATKFIERNKDRPFSLTVTFNAPHILKVAKPYPVVRQEYDAAQAAGQVVDVPKVPTARPGDAAKYAAQFPGDTARADTVATIAALDEAVGRILDKVNALGLDRRTIVFLFSDNGGHPENRSENLPFRDYKWSVYEGGIRVPFLAMYPGVFPAGLTFPQPVSSLDIFPTIAALTAAKPPSNLDGVDLTPYVSGHKSGAPHEALYFSLNGANAVRAGDWKLVLPPEGAAALYDLRSDPEERTDLSAKFPDRVADLKTKLEAWMKQMPAPKGPPPGAAGKRRPGRRAGAPAAPAPSE